MRHQQAPRGTTRHQEAPQGTRRQQITINTQLLISILLTIANPKDISHKFRGG